MRYNSTSLLLLVSVLNSKKGLCFSAEIHPSIGYLTKWCYSENFWVSWQKNIGVGNLGFGLFQLRRVREAPEFQSGTMFYRFQTFSSSNLQLLCIVCFNSHFWHDSQTSFYEISELITEEYVRLSFSVVIWVFNVYLLLNSCEVLGSGY